MDPITQNQVQKVQRFSRDARAVCVLLAVCLAVDIVWTMANILGHPYPDPRPDHRFVINVGAYLIPKASLDVPLLKGWAFLYAATIYAPALFGLFYLRALFGNLYAGNIYTRETVRRLRQVGVVAVVLAIQQIVMPLLSQLLLSEGMVTAGAVTPNPLLFPSAQQPIVTMATSQLPGLITAALLLLASWILEIGRQTRDEADAMRSESELVV